MSDFDLFANWHSEYTDDDWRAMNERLKHTPEPYREPEIHKPRHTSGPSFATWFRLPETKRLQEPPQVKRMYKVNITGAFYGCQDRLGNNFNRIQAEVNGRHILVNQYDDGSYVVKDEKSNRAYQADGGNLDDVIDGIVT